MKWGVRRFQNKNRSNRRREPKTQWGKDRQYAKQQNKLNKTRWKETKSKVRSGKLSRKSSEYQKERQRYKDYNHERNFARKTRMSKAAQGKYMRKMGISASKPNSTKPLGKQVGTITSAGLKQTGKHLVKAAVTTAVIRAGAKFVAKQLGERYARDHNGIPRLKSGNIITLKPNQYRVLS